jgi:hypothetical protein
MKTQIRILLAVAVLVLLAGLLALRRGNAELQARLAAPAAAEGGR